MPQTVFTKKVAADIQEFLNQNNKVFANEQDFQMNLAVYLKSVKHYDVEVECHVPADIISSLLDSSLPWRCTYYPWTQARSDKPQEMYVDMVVSDGQEYVPVELKYKKKLLQGNVTLFGQDMGAGVLLKDDAAQDLGRYGFWKDVRRIEFLTKAFDKIHNGIALLVTNDTSYNAPGAGNSANFSMGDGTATYHKDTNCSWPFNPLDSDSYKSSPNFKLESEHEVTWRDYTFAGVALHCAEVMV